MPNKMIVAKRACSSLENQKQAGFSLKEELRKTAGRTLGQEQITPLVMEGDEITALQNSHISHNEERPGLHASSLGLAESIGGVSGEESSCHAAFAASYSYRFPCQPIHSAPTSQFLDMMNCQVGTQKRISGDTETVYTRSVGHQGCSTLGGMPSIGNRNQDDTQNAHYNQLLDQSSWINITLEASRQHFGGLSINSPGANTQSDEPQGLNNYFNSMNCMHQEMGNGSDVTVTAKVVPVGNQASGIQPTTQDLQGMYENYGTSSNHNISKVQKQQRFSHSVKPYSKMTKKARELLKKKQIEEQLAFVDNFHGICPKLVYIPAFSTIRENENLTPPSPTWPGK